MSQTDDLFRVRLLETFREEAGEYIESITAGLIELEKAGPAPEVVESVYRRIHSLKGAARAVNLREIESVCQNLETIFSLIKRGEYIPGMNDFDLFHRTLAVVKALLQGERPDTSPVDIIGALRSIPERPANEPVLRPPEVHTGEPAKSKETPEPIIHTSGTHNGSDPTISGPDGGMVRIAAHKLERLTAGADGLLSTEISITQRIRELEEMVTRFTLWQWNHSQAFNDLNLIRRKVFGEEKTTLPHDLVLPLQRAVEFQEYNREFVTTLQHDLATHLRAMGIIRVNLTITIRPCHAPAGHGDRPVSAQGEHIRDIRPGSRRRAPPHLKHACAIFCIREGGLPRIEKIHRPHDRRGGDRGGSAYTRRTERTHHAPDPQQHRPRYRGSGGQGSAGQTRHRFRAGPGLPPLRQQGRHRGGR